MLSVLVELLNQEFEGFLERNGERLSINIRYSPKDVMVLGPLPVEMELGTDIQYIKFQDGTVLASAKADSEFRVWEQGLSEGIQTLRLLDPRVYAVLLRDGKLREKDGVPIRGGLTRIFADYPTAELATILGMPDEVGRVMAAMITELDEVAFDFSLDQYGRPQSMIRKELSPSEDEIFVHFKYL